MSVIKKIFATTWLVIAVANSSFAAEIAARAEVADANKPAESAALDNEEMAKKLANPISNMISMPIQWS